MKTVNTEQIFVEISKLVALVSSLMKVIQISWKMQGRCQISLKETSEHYGDEIGSQIINQELSLIINHLSISID